MNINSIKLMCCPLCHSELTLSVREFTKDYIIEGLLECTRCERVYPIKEGIPDFLVNEILSGRDRKVMLEYERIALNYDIFVSYIVPLVSLGLEPFERYLWIRELRLRAGSVVLDVATGTGRNLGFLVRKVGKYGRIFGLDISWNVLLIAKGRQKDTEMLNL